MNKQELFAYDPSRPLNVQEVGAEMTPEGVCIREITYDAYDTSINTKRKISCYLVEPKGDGPFPFVLYFHWYGNHGSNKKWFLEEATALGDQGIGGLLIDGFFPWEELPSEIGRDKARIVYQVIELRRALDYMISLPNVDAGRLGYVGHDYGALFGSLLSGADGRIGSYVLVAGMGNFSEWFLKYWVPLDDEGERKYRAAMEELDPVNHVGRAAPARLLFQFAEDDYFIAEAVADEFYAAASQPKSVKFYAAAHEMDTEEVRLDRDAWLLESLK